MPTSSLSQKDSQQEAISDIDLHTFTIKFAKYMIKQGLVWNAQMDEIANEAYVLAKCELLPKYQCGGTLTAEKYLFKMIRFRMIDKYRKDKRKRSKEKLAAKCIAVIESQPIECLPIGNLSNKLRPILEMLARGFTIQQIANAMYCSVSTIHERIKYARWLLRTHNPRGTHNENGKQESGGS